MFVTEWCFVGVSLKKHPRIIKVIHVYYRLMNSIRVTCMLTTIKPQDQNEVYVAWKWTWKYRSVFPPPCPSTPTSPQDSPWHSPDNDETDVDTDSYHVVKFKCIGAPKDDDGQAVLKAIGQLEKELDKVEV